MTIENKAASGAEAVIFLTPSYRNDVDRLVLMRRSIRKYYRGEAEHIVAVPKEDINIFRSALKGDDCKLITQNSLVDKEYFSKPLFRIIKKYFPNQAWRFNRHAGKGGWIIQQIVKLSAYKLIESGAIIVLDSDLFFVRPFCDADLGLNNGKILVRNIPDTESGKHRRHIANARKLLGLLEGSTEHHYMSCPAVLYADWLRELVSFLEAKYAKPWQQVLLEQDIISEYSIYGVFLEEILRPLGLIIHDRTFNHMIWDMASYQSFLSDPEYLIGQAPDKLCVVVQSALGIPARQYLANFEILLGEELNVEV